MFLVVQFQTQHMKTIWEATCLTGMHYMDPRSFPRRCSSYGLSEQVLHDCPAEHSQSAWKWCETGNLISCARLSCFNRSCPPWREWKSQKHPLWSNTTVSHVLSVYIYKNIYAEQLFWGGRQWSPNQDMSSCKSKLTVLSLENQISI